MGFTGNSNSKKKKKKNSSPSFLHVMDSEGGNGGYVDSDTNSKKKKKWVFAGINGFISPIFTNNNHKNDHPILEDQEDGYFCTTPTSDESRIMSSRFISCPPPAPKKRKSSSICHDFRGEFFTTPPDLESVFIRRTEKA